MLGMQANHTSLASFQKQLKEIDIELSRMKVQKILITGGCWTTQYIILLWLAGQKSVA